MDQDTLVDRACKPCEIVSLASGVRRARQDAPGIGHDERLRRDEISTVLIVRSRVMYGTNGNDYVPPDCLEDDGGDVGK